jgi:hypothetical protein
MFAAKPEPTSEALRPAFEAISQRMIVDAEHPASHSARRIQFA